MLLADEPTGQLDSATGEQIMELLEELHREGMTVLLVTHDERVAAHCPRRVTIKDGRLREGEEQGDERLTQN